MCGRTACTLGPNDLINRCTKSLPKTSKNRPLKWVDNNHDGHVYTTSFNKAPGSVCPVLVAKEHLPKSADAREEDEKEDSADDICVFPMLWGLVPAWHEGHPQKHGLSTSNCRSEGMFEKKMFSECLKNHRRCVVVVDGFYEWKTEEVKSGAGKKSTSKQPYFIFHGSNAEQQDTPDDDDDDTSEDRDASAECKDTEKDDSSSADTEDSTAGSESTNPQTAVTSSLPSPPSQILAIAGLFRIGSARSGEGRDPKNSLYSYSVITVPSSSAMDWLHERQPAILTSEEEIVRWLSIGELTSSEVKELIRPVTSLGFYPVSSLVNNARVNDEQCMAPIDLKEEEEKKKPKPNALTNWLVQGATKSATASDAPKKASVIKDEKKTAKKGNVMSAWLTKGKRKSDALGDTAGDAVVGDEEARKKLKNDDEDI